MTTTLWLALAGLANVTLAESTRRSVLAGLHPAPYHRTARHTISAIIPAYQEAAYIGEALQSLQNQTEPIAEIIVMDSSPPGDQTGHISRAQGAVVYPAPPGNASRSRNIGASRSSGEVLLFLDADMVASCHLVETGLDALETGILAHPRLVYHDSGMWNSLLFVGNLLRPPSMASGCQMVWSHSFQDLGGLDEQCNPFQLGGPWCPEMQDFSRRVIRRWGADAVHLLPFLVGASARRFRRYGLDSRGSMSVPVRQGLRRAGRMHRREG